jgi:hypothetical protein
MFLLILTKARKGIEFISLVLLTVAQNMMRSLNLPDL